ncbi:hypothetical protein [Photobacterium leiognathi]|uniref:hypothetical protein n=1 Tax=Photobacterium leiognathi TaxID=553611 RepID=UPI002980C8FC|nr:hypothetical protein [Photobacterium leiognathi]
MYTFIYFSYKKDFYSLLKSVDTVICNFPDSYILVFEDPDNKFTEEQILILSQKVLSISPHPLGFSPKNGNGKDNFKAQIKAYNLAIKETKAEFIIKIDSDTLINDRFNRYLNKDVDFIGTEVSYLGESKYIYGNLYVMSKKFVKKLADITDCDFNKLNSDAKKYYAENRVIYGLSNILNVNKKIYSHDKGYVFNLDFISNVRIARSSNTKIINSFSLSEMNEYPSIHYWSSEKLIRYHKDRNFLLFYIILLKKNFKNLMRYLVNKL